MGTQANPTKKKIFIVLTSLSIGGAQQQLIRQLPRFDAARFEIHVMALFACVDARSLADDVPPHIQVHQLRFSGFFDLWSVFGLCRALRAIQPDLVMTSLFFSNTIMRIIQPFFGYPVITREHNTYIHKGVVAIWTDRVLARVSKKIVAVSEEVADFTSAQEHIPREKFLVIHNGIDSAALDTTHSIDRSSLRIAADAHLCLFVGRFAAQKNVPLLLEGFAQFCKAHTSWVLVLVGDGPIRQTLEVHAQSLGITDQVRFVGEQRQVYPYYQIADCLVSTSHIEGMSNTHLEALAHGVPVLTTPTGGTSALIVEGETGFIVPAYTPAAVAETLHTFAQHMSNNMRQAAKKKAQEFTIEKTVQQYEQLFETYAR